jgi:hypothetical protein
MVRVVWGKVPTRLWRWNRQGVPKRWHIKFRRRGIIQKKAHNIQNKAKVWNREGKRSFRNVFKISLICNSDLGAYSIHTNNENVCVTLGLLMFCIPIFDEFHFRKLRIKPPPQESVCLQFPGFNPRGYCGAYKKARKIFRSVVELIVHMIKYE